VQVSVTPIRIIPGQGIDVLDQTRLPHQEARLRLTTVEAVREAIATLRVRGAPLLGIVGAATLAISATESGSAEGALKDAATRISATRPTAVDLANVTAEALALALIVPEGPGRVARLWANAEALLARQHLADRALSQFGATLIARGAAVLTHCNTGALATGAYGTALGVVRAAHEQGRLARCYATETRPLLQGARLTMWELGRAGIPGTLLPDTAAASLIASGAVEAVIVGADRIAANGDTANKIGTYGLALAAARHGLPFYVAAPLTSFDPATRSGPAIPIEFRSAAEVGGFAGERWTPAGGDAYNPAFDVTPAGLITAFITETGIIQPPFSVTIARAVLSPNGGGLPGRGRVAGEVS
jgi:methylthioribose-1-phosphate isomerase